MAARAPTIAKLRLANSPSSPMPTHHNPTGVAKSKSSSAIGHSASSGVINLPFTEFKDLTACSIALESSTRLIELIIAVAPIPRCQIRTASTAPYSATAWPTRSSPGSPAIEITSRACTCVNWLATSHSRLDTSAQQQHRFHLECHARVNLQLSRTPVILDLPHAPTIAKYLDRANSVL